MLREFESERPPDDSSERAQTGSKRNGENDLLSLASLVQSGNGGGGEAAPSMGVPAIYYANGVSHRSPGLFATCELPWVGSASASFTPKALQSSWRDLQGM